MVRTPITTFKRYHKQYGQHRVCIAIVYLATFHEDPLWIGIG